MRTERCRNCGEDFQPEHKTAGWMQRGRTMIPLANGDQHLFNIKVTHRFREEMQLCDVCWPWVWEEIGEQLFHRRFTLLVTNGRYDPYYERKQILNRINAGGQL